MLVLHKEDAISQRYWNFDQVRSGEECPKSLHEEDGTTAVDADALGIESLVSVLLGNHLLPRLAVLDPSHGHHELTVFVLFGDDFKVAFLIEVDEGFDVDSLDLDEGRLLEGEEGAGLGSNVDDAAALVVLDNAALDDIIPVEGVVSGGNGLIKGGVGEANFILNIRVNLDLGPLVF